MSYTEIFGFDKDGNAYSAGEVQNAWRGAWSVWTYFEDKYLPLYIPDYIKYTIWYKPNMSNEEVISKNGFKPTRLNSNDGSIQEIWNLVDDTSISVNERIVLMTTFDKVLVKKENLQQVINAFNSFPNKDTSLKQQAQILQTLLNDNNCIAVGWNQNSVCADNWTNFNKVDDTIKPYNCLKQDEHCWLFDELVEE